MSSFEPVLVQNVDIDGQKTVELTLPNQNRIESYPYSLTIKHQRVIHYQGNQKDAWGHSNGPITTSIKRYTLAKEEITINDDDEDSQGSTSSSASSISSSSMVNNSFAVQILPMQNGLRKATISMKTQDDQSSTGQIDFNSLQNSVNRIGCIDSIHVRIMRSTPSSSTVSSKSKNDTKRFTKLISSNLLGGLYKSYSNHCNQKSSQIVLEKRLYKKDLLTKSWRSNADVHRSPSSGIWQVGRSMNQYAAEEDEEEDECEQIIVPTLLDLPPPYRE